MHKDGAGVGFPLATMEMSNTLCSFPRLCEGSEESVYISWHIGAIAEREGLRYKALWALFCGGSLWHEALVTPVVSCTDGRTSRRGAQYVGDPAQGSSRLLWETVEP